MMATSGSARGGRLGLSKLLKDGFVRGALSEGTLLYLAAFNIVEVARKFMCKKAVPVFQNNVWDDSKNVRWTSAQKPYSMHNQCT